MNPKLNSTLSINRSTPDEWVTFEGFENAAILLGIKSHLSRSEIKVFYRKGLRINFLNKPLDIYENLHALTREQKGYSYLLAFCRRISLPLDMSFSASLSYDKYPIHQLTNFRHFEELFEKYYPTFEKLDFDNSAKKANFKKNVIQVLFKFWLSGYGIAPGYTDEVIDTPQLVFLQKYDTLQLVRVSRFIGFILSNETFSPISEVPKVKETTNLETRELGKWQNVLTQYNCEITKELFSFTFNPLKERIDKSTLIEYPDSNNNLVRESLSPITSGTWVDLSGSLRRLATLLCLNDYYTIDETLKQGLFAVMTDDLSQLSNDIKKKTRIATKHWLTWYVIKHNLKLNLTRIIPISVRNSDRSYGAMLNMGAAQTLIQTLLDENCAYFDESKIIDYRARRACLLQLATGQRGSEICNLLRNCIKTDNMGTKWIIFHKTKFSNSNEVVATPDILRWVGELQQVASSQNILISTSKYPYGDDLKAYRLFANQFDDGPYTYDSMNKFLVRIQDKLWGTSHPNNRAFTTHDLRRLHALYMRLRGNSKTEIQEKLGHTDINSQLPYLGTKPLSHQKHFKTISLKGVYNNITSRQSSKTIQLEPILEKSIDMDKQNFSNELIISLIEKVSTDVNSFDIPRSTSTFNPLPTGFPMRSHSCNATTMVNCGHTELHCFQCNKYKPDPDTLDDHKIEVFRYMVFSLYHDKLTKQSKDILEKQLIQVRSNDINRLIDNTFNELFNKFSLTMDQINIIRQDLIDAAKRYSKKYYKSNPKPSFMEAKQFIKEGVVYG